MRKNILLDWYKGTLLVKITGLGQCLVSGREHDCPLFAYVMNAYKKLAGPNWFVLGVQNVNNWQLAGASICNGFLSIEAKRRE